MRRRGFTLIELLVVIAIIAVLIGLLLPAVQKVRDAAQRAACQNNLHQLAVAAHNYHGDNQSFPPGVYQMSFNSAPKFRGITLFVYLAPYIEQGNVTKSWNLTDPMQNTVGGQSAPTATVVPSFVCPADVIPQNPYFTGSVWYGMTSYGGNGGSRSYDPASATNDGIFFVIGPGSQTAPTGGPVRIGDVTDGVSNTILFGERSHVDPNQDSFAANFAVPSGAMVAINPMGETGWWASSGGRLAAGDVTLSAYAPINYRVPASYANRASMNPPVKTVNDYAYYNDRRVCAFGSNHTGGANFAMADGSVRFISDSIPLATLQLLCVRNDGQPVGAF
jgi:prepilin-type N-terminal cleavage/methylation domain-containing protein/prepilin-type processing-associated H-X9-DG protein